jgi:hypothetical protein
MAEQTATERADAEKANQEAYTAALKEMTDSAIRDRVAAVHVNAASSPESLKAMQEDYKRLAEDKAKEEEVAKASATATKPMGTSG